MNRWNDVINAWLIAFPEIKLTDQQYIVLENLIEEYGSDRWESGIGAGQDSMDRR